MNRCLPITRSNTNRPMTRPPASAFQARPGCVSTKLVADGKASFCASGIDRYWTAWAEEVIETTAAAGAVQLFQSGIVVCFPFAVAPPPRGIDMRPRADQASEEKSDAAENRIRVGA